MEIAVYEKKPLKKYDDGTLESFLESYNETLSDELAMLPVALENSNG